MIRSAPIRVWQAGLMWLSAAVTFMLVGSDDVGWNAPYRAWSEGFTSFPRWVQGVFAVVGTPIVLLSCVVLGCAVAAEGRRVAVKVALSIAGTVVVVSVFVTLAMAAWPDAPHSQ